MRGFCIGVLTALAAGSPALAADVTFSGTVSGVCSLALSTPGTLALSTDGSKLGSQEPGGLPALVTILSIGSATVTVDPPTRTAQASTPVPYVATGEVIEVAYQGLAGLSGVTQAYTTSQTSFGVNTLPLTVLQVHNRITNANGFPAGPYATRTVVTCS
jgi:hypothetical protein